MKKASKTSTGGMIHKKLTEALSEASNQLKEDGIHVPSLSLSVKDDTTEEFKPKVSFVKQYLDHIDYIEDIYGLNLTEKGIIMTLTKYISYQNNHLCHEDGTPLKRKDLEGILDLAHSAVDKYMASLIRKGVLAKVTVKRSSNYYLNPHTCYMGKYIDKTLLSMFRHTQIKSQIASKN